ncbi:aminotransferase class I/II-fold pyridoxal phosphate-dependent enzyme, partial [Arenimonas sp.]|uniref:aminotransferase class I/II-fold pyridoxal phosphate-dependent enzyme n=1 Tax=Arenimonas sp. TaxID=1872635 RepID=UPI002E32F49A
MLYDGNVHTSLLKYPEIADRLIVLDGWSKTYAMTGWRMGYAIVPDWLVKAYSQLIINTISGVTAFAQAGGIEALRGPQDEVEAMVREFDARRNLIVDGLNEIPGCRCAKPQGAFYVFPDISCAFGKSHGGKKIANDVDFCSVLLEAKGVACVPGSAFGEPRAMRISYTCPTEQLPKGLQRIQEFFAELS